MMLNSKPSPEQPNRRDQSTLMVGTFLLLTLAACSEDTVSESEPAVSQAPVSAAAEAEASRWYSSAVVEQGQVVFAQHCAACHGDAAQGLTADWRTRQPDGSFPPPPLNGSAHAWHHPLQQLLQTIDTGGIPYGGQMPPFDDVLGDDDKLAAIAYFQNFWSQEIYLAWLDRGGLD
ncbi:MAG: cytochrome c [Gammaproteobacteria bacterium]